MFRETNAKFDTTLLTMSEAMEYLSNKGIPCRSRTKFYRIIKDFNIGYVNVNKSGKNEIRRFTKEELDKVLKV